MSKKIVTDKEDWEKIAQEFNSNDLPKVTEIDTDQSIEERVMAIIDEGFSIYPDESIDTSYDQLKSCLEKIATEQDLISKARECEFSEWCSVNGWYFYSKDNIWRKHGNGGFDYKTTEELFNQFTNK